MSRKSIVHAEHRAGLSVAAAAVIHETDPNFRTAPEGEVFKRVILPELKYQARFDAAPTAGVMTLQVLSGSTVIHTESFGAGDQVQAGVVPLSTNEIEAGSLLSVKAEVTTVFGTATTVDLDAQIYFKEPFVTGCS